MGHNICALIVTEPFDEHAAREWDVEGIPLGRHLRLVHISDYYTAYMQARRGATATLDVPADFPDDFPRQAVLADLAAALAGDRAGGRVASFAVVMTEYFGGAGEQWACAFAEGKRVEPAHDINIALRALGVRAAAGLDEFDTVGLSAHRSTPEHLDRYRDLCGELGV